MYVQRMSTDLKSGVPVVEGELRADGLRVAIVVARFNAFVTERLLEGAQDALLRSGAKAEDLCIFKTPGSYELPMVTKKVAQLGRFDGIIALGCLMRGDTIHFDLIAAEACKGLAGVSLDLGIPVAFGVLTTDTLEQAVHRAGAKAGNKGAEAAMAVVEQVNLLRAIAALNNPS